jgi:transcriptional regulator with PAS, ATPase and Fis domain
VNGVRQTSVALNDGDLIEAGQTFFLFRTGMVCESRDDVVLDSADIKRPHSLVSLRPSLARIFRDAAKIAGSALSVLILGETGTGKELIAREVHTLSPREGNFVAQNCGAFAANLLESQLFGHKKGAFTGAVADRPGVVRSADGGTLFLDEIGELPLDSQAAFLRVLEEREVVPLGETRPVPVDLRVVAATNQDIGAMVAQKRFRADLLARLCGHVVRLPALRQRPEDIGILLGSLLKRIARDRAESLGLTTEAARSIIQYQWPFNIRELRERLSRALLLSDGVLSRSSLFPDASVHDESIGVDRMEHIERLLAKHRGNVAAVARELKKDPAQIRRWARQSGIEIDRYRKPGTGNAS